MGVPGGDGKVQLIPSHRVQLPHRVPFFEHIQQVVVAVAVHMGQAQIARQDNADVREQVPVLGHHRPAGVLCPVG